MKHSPVNLEPLRVPVTARLIIMGAAASRDWQPQHHDAAWASAAGLPGIIMNNYTQAGWAMRYATDWSGPQGRIGRLRLAMRNPICAGDLMEISGVVSRMDMQSDELAWAELDVTFAIGDRVATKAFVRIAIPAKQGATSPWHCAPHEWRP